MDTTERIIQYIQQNGQATILDLTEHLGISRRGTTKQISKLLANGQLSKTGDPPQKVFYRLSQAPDLPTKKLVIPASPSFGRDLVKAGFKRESRSCKFWIPRPACRQAGQCQKEAFSRFHYTLTSEAFIILRNKA